MAESTSPLPFEKFGLDLPLHELIFMKLDIISLQKCVSVSKSFQSFVVDHLKGSETTGKILDKMILDYRWFKLDPHETRTNKEGFDQYTGHIKDTFLDDELFLLTTEFIFKRPSGEDTRRGKKIFKYEIVDISDPFGKPHNPGRQEISKSADGRTCVKIIITIVRHYGTASWINIVKKIFNFFFTFVFLAFLLAYELHDLKCRFKFEIPPISFPVMHSVAGATLEYPAKAPNYIRTTNVSSLKAFCK